MSFSTAYNQERPYRQHHLGMTSILVTKGQGNVYFFSMATSFTKAALGAEGVGKDINLIVGNGYAKGHAELTLGIIRESAEIRELFNKLYVK